MKKVTSFTLNLAAAAAVLIVLASATIALENEGWVHPIN